MLTIPDIVVSLSLLKPDLSNIYAILVAVKKGVSSPEESHLQALSEPGVNLSSSPGLPIVPSPMVRSLPASVET